MSVIINISNLEKIYQTDSSTKQSIETEKHRCIELSDEMIAARFVYREPCKVDKDSPEYLKQKHALAEALCKESFLIKVISHEKEPYNSR